MRFARMKNSTVWTIGAGVLVLSAVGCTHIGTVGNPRAYMQDRASTRVWVTGPDNRTVALSHARVANDTLSGFDGSQYYEVAMGDVKRLQAKVPAPGNTALAVGIGVVAAGLVVAELTSAGSKAGCEVLVGGTQTQLYPGGPLVSQGVYAPCPPSN